LVRSRKPSPDREVLEAAVDRFGRPVAGAGPVAVGQDVGGRLFEGSAEGSNLGRDGGNAAGQEVDEVLHLGFAGGPVGCKTKMKPLIDSLSAAVPAALCEVRRLGRTLKQRAADVLANFDRPGTSNGPTEAINGRLEHLRGSALGFRNLTNYVARSLLETGGFRPGPQINSDEPDQGAGKQTR
jgi:hypothetical protein